MAYSLEFLHYLESVFSKFNRATLVLRDSIEDEDGIGIMDFLLGMGTLRKTVVRNLLKLYRESNITHAGLFMLETERGVDPLQYCMDRMRQIIEMLKSSDFWKCSYKDFEESKKIVEEVEKFVKVQVDYLTKIIADLQEKDEKIKKAILYLRKLRGKIESLEKEMTPESYKVLEAYFLWPTYFYEDDAPDTIKRNQEAIMKICDCYQAVHLRRDLIQSLQSHDEVIAGPLILEIKQCPVLELWKKLQSDDWKTRTAPSRFDLLEATLRAKREYMAQLIEKDPERRYVGPLLDEINQWSLEEIENNLKLPRWVSLPEKIKHFERDIRRREELIQRLREVNLVYTSSLIARIKKWPIDQIEENLKLENWESEEKLDDLNRWHVQRLWVIENLRQFGTSSENLIQALDDCPIDRIQEKLTESRWVCVLKNIHHFSIDIGLRDSLVEALKPFVQSEQDYLKNLQSELGRQQALLQSLLPSYQAYLQAEEAEKKALETIAHPYEEVRYSITYDSFDLGYRNCHGGSPTKEYYYQTEYSVALLEKAKKDLESARACLENIKGKFQQYNQLKTAISLLDEKVRRAENGPGPASGLVNTAQRLEVDQISEQLRADDWVRRAVEVLGQASVDLIYQKYKINQLKASKASLEGIAFIPSAPPDDIKPLLGEMQESSGVAVLSTAPEGEILGNEPNKGLNTPTTVQPSLPSIAAGLSRLLVFPAVPKNSFQSTLEEDAEKSDEETDEDRADKKGHVLIRN